MLVGVVRPHGVGRGVGEARPPRRLLLRQLDGRPARGVVGDRVQIVALGAVAHEDDPIALRRDRGLERPREHVRDFKDLPVAHAVRVEVVDAVGLGVGAEQHVLAVGRPGGVADLGLVPGGGLELQRLQVEQVEILEAAPAPEGQRQRPPVGRDGERVNDPRVPLKRLEHAGLARVQIKHGQGGAPVAPPVAGVVDAGAVGRDAGEVGALAPRQARLPSRLEIEAVEVAADGEGAVHLELGVDERLPIGGPRRA